MRKISSYLYPNRIELLADLAAFTVEYVNVYQRNVKIYNGIDNTIEFDIKNADQKRIDLTTLSNIELNIMDAEGTALPNSPYTVTPTAVKGIATVTIPQDDLIDLQRQFLKYSVSAVSSGNDVLLYADSRFGAVGTIELVGDAMPTFRDPKEYNSFTAEIDLKGVPTWHSSAIPATFYEAVKTETMDFSISLKGFTGSVWLEATKNSTINTEAFKGADYISSVTLDDFTGIWQPTSQGSTDIPIGDYKYFRVSYSTPTVTGNGASFSVHKENNVYTATIRAGGTGYSNGSRIKILGSALGGVDGINDLTVTVTELGGAGGMISSYTISSIQAISSSGTASDGTATYIVTGTNITGTVDKVVAE